MTANNLPVMTVEKIDHVAAGAAMRAMREKKKVSLRAVATRLGFSPAYVSDLELGKRNWDKDKAAKFIAAINQ